MQPNYTAASKHLRELTTAEVDDLYTRLAERWGVQERCWYPLFPGRSPSTEAFQDHFFETEFGYERLRQILTAGGVQRIYELREDGRGFEIATTDIEPYYTGLEGYWLTDSCDWLIYASHESSVTVGGAWLLPEVCAAWPGWKQRVWTTPFYDRQ